MGVAVRPGAPVARHLERRCAQALVLAAESIVFNRASSGIYFENLLKKMEIYDQVQARTTRYADGAAVMEHVLKAKAGKSASGGHGDPAAPREGPEARRAFATRGAETTLRIPRRR